MKQEKTTPSKDVRVQTLRPRSREVGVGQLGKKVATVSRSVRVCHGLCFDFLASNR